MCRVYVGTYKKYNEGSIAGGWISLDECENYGQFLAKCRSLHKNERDPEFMIQDSEGFPDGLDCMEWLSESEFNDVKKAMSEEEKPCISIVQYSEKSFVVTGDTYPVKDNLKALGGKWFRKEQAWLFPKTKLEEVQAFINSGTIAAGKEEGKNNRFADDLKEFLETQCKNDSDRKYYGKGCVGAIKFGEHYLLIDKPSIKNRFCFHDEGPNYELYKSLHADEGKMRQYFVNQNEFEFTNKISRIEKGEEVRLKESDYMNEICLYIGGYYYDRQEGRLATEEEKALILDGLKYGLTCYRKRLNAYLKKYGVSKIHTWTYWADA